MNSRLSQYLGNYDVKCQNMNSLGTTITISQQNTNILYEAARQPNSRMQWRF